MIKAVRLKEAVDEKLYGGKCASLGRALRAGLPTPDGFALGVTLVKTVVDGDKSRVAEISELFVSAVVSVVSGASFSGASGASKFTSGSS